MTERNIGNRDDFGEGKIGKRNSEKFELTYSETKREINGRREKRRRQKEFWGFFRRYIADSLSRMPNQILPRGRIFALLRIIAMRKSGAYDVVLDRASSIKKIDAESCSSISEPGFDPGTCGLWAHHASAAPL
ncbi:hypothetical protein PanWU01x14_225170 [Parasponia andersonii]|uniref:Uncharacterized protein n=1 Tax=Parasponia andersonii TaxID=3476 RepID=A0A2P5BMP7_PARAD|nr:hypothetical protein PanWU01x14_225170 [Parasponia andersonii]